MDDSTTNFSPLPRSSLGGGMRSATGPGEGRPSVGGLLQDEDMSLALGGEYDDDDEADADPFQVATQTREDDGDDEPTVRLDSSSNSRPHAKSSADLFFGGSMAASSSSSARAAKGPPPAVGAATGVLAPGAGFPPPSSPSLASPRATTSTAFSSRLSTTHARTPSGTAAAETTHSKRYEPDEDDLTDSALESRGLSGEELARVRALRDEREGLRTMNAVLEDVLGALKLTEGKMENFQATIDTSHQLLDLYARIASQAEHTKDLLLDGEWEGVERDYEFLAAREQAAREAEEAAQREAEERAAREEAERVRKAQEEQWKRDQAEMASVTGRGGRGGLAGGTRVRGRGCELGIRRFLFRSVRLYRERSRAYIACRYASLTHAATACSARQRLFRRATRFRPRTTSPLFLNAPLPNNLLLHIPQRSRQRFAEHVLLDVGDSDARIGDWARRSGERTRDSSRRAGGDRKRAVERFLI